MNIIQCKICKKPFQSIGGMTCPDCLIQIDRDYITVRDYIYENPHSHMDKVSEETGVSKAIIMQLLKEGRLILESADTEGLLRCEMCKKTISSGRMCQVCKSKVASTMNKSMKNPNPAPQEKKDLNTGKHNAKMHTDIISRK